MSKYVILDTKLIGVTGYVFLHQDKKETSTAITSIDNAMKFNKQELKFVYDNFTDVWVKHGYKVHEIKMELGRPVNMWEL